MPSYVKTKLRRVYVGSESVAFGTEPATADLYKYLHTVNASMVTQDVGNLEPDYDDDRLSRNMHEVGVKGSEIGYGVPLRAHGTVPGSGSQISAPELSIPLTHMFGSLSQGWAQAVQAGSTTTVVNVTNGGQYTVGMMVWSSQRAEMRVVTAINTNALTVSPAFSSAPTTGTLVGSNCYAAVDTGHSSLSFVSISGVGGTLYEHTLTGCVQKSAKISLKTGQLPMMDFSYMADNWLENTSITHTSGSGLPAAEDSFTGRPVKMTGQNLYVDGVAKPIYSLDLDFQMDMNYAEGFDGANGRTGFELTKRRINGSMSAYKQSAHATDLAAGTERALVFPVFTSTAPSWGFYAPKVQFTKVKGENNNGMYGEQVDFAVNKNGDSVAFYLSVF